MKAYKFRFDTVLKSKGIIVDQLAAKVARARNILMLEERKLEDLGNLQARCMLQTRKLQTGRVDTVEIQRCHEYLKLLGEAVAEQQNTVKEIARRVEMLRKMLTDAEKDRKIFERLDEKEREEFRREFLKKEQAILDEVGVNRFVQRAVHERFRSSAP